MGTNRGIANKLLKLKEEIEQAQKEHSEKVGEVKALEAQLKQEFGAESLEQAEEQLTQLEKEIEQVESNLESKVEDIEQRFENG